MRHSEETRRKMSEAKKGKNIPASTRAKISATKRGVPNSSEHNAAISAGLKGVPKSAESNEKRREAAKAYWSAKKVEKPVRKRFKIYTDVNDI